MKRSFALLMSVLLLGGLIVFAAGCNEAAEPANEEQTLRPHWNLRDGDYRGHFDDREHNVSVQVTIEDEEIVGVSLRYQQYDGIVYEEDPEVPDDYPITPEQIEGMAQQYEESLEYLIGAQGVEEIEERLGHMEGNPSGPALEAIETEDVDGFSSATIRSSKLASAVRDAFNRGRYRE